LPLRNAFLLDCECRGIKVQHSPVELRSDMRLSITFGLSALVIALALVPALVQTQTALPPPTTTTKMKPLPPTTTTMETTTLPPETQPTPPRIRFQADMENAPEACAEASLTYLGVGAKNTVFRCGDEVRRVSFSATLRWLDGGNPLDLPTACRIELDVLKAALAPDAAPARAKAALEDATFVLDTRQRMPSAPLQS
jgi:hypothetical protein